MELEFTEESAAAFMQMNERIAQCTFGTRALNACNELTHLILFCHRPADVCHPVLALKLGAGERWANGLHCEITLV